MNIPSIFVAPSELITDHVSVQGYSHKQIDKECQDHSLSWKEKNYAAIIVCDGHGGDKYIRSAVGSGIACEVGKEKISEFMSRIGADGAKVCDNLERLENSIVGLWRERVEADFAERPIDADECFEKLEDADRSALLKNPVKAYGSTFIAAVLTKHYSFVIKLGDGNAMLFYPDCTCEMPEELVDEDLQFNVTTSLCNSDAAMCFRHCFRQAGISGITLTSDGVINSYLSEESYISFMENVYDAYGEEDAEAIRDELLKVLDTLSEKGSGDDLSVSVARFSMTDQEMESLREKREREEAERVHREAEKIESIGENPQGHDDPKVPPVIYDPGTKSELRILKAIKSIPCHIKRSDV